MKKSHLLTASVLLGAISAQAYVLNINSSGNVRRWNLETTLGSVPTNSVNVNTRAIRYYLASDGYSAGNKTAELNALRSSFGQWQAISGTHLKFEEAGLMAPGYDVNTTDNTNVLYWAKSSTIVNGGLNNISGALGVTFSRSSNPGNNLIQGDIVFNGVEAGWFTDISDTGNANYFIEGVALHEIGHFIGLNHSPVGGATMIFGGVNGLNAQAGLSSDDIAAARILYGTNSSFGTIKGTVTKNGSPVLGAAVFVQTSTSNLVAGTVSIANGTYELTGLTAGNYLVRVAPLDSTANPDEFLIRGVDIASTFQTADTDFLPTGNSSVSINVGATNTLNFAVTAGTPAFTITRIREATNSISSYRSYPGAVAMTVGQSNYYVGVGSPNLPTSGATLTITGDGLTLGNPIFVVGLGTPPKNFISVPISVSSNATPGLRSFIVQSGGNVAYASGFLEIKPKALDYNFDGLDDAFQRKYFPLFTAANAAPGADPDGDGFPNYSEYVAATIPTNSLSLIKVQSTTTTASGTTVKWQSVEGKKYQLMSLINITSGTWQNVGSVFTAAGTTSQLLDPAATSGNRFYRVQALP